MLIFGRMSNILLDTGPKSTLLSVVSFDLKTCDQACIASRRMSPALRRLPPLGMQMSFLSSHHADPALFHTCFHPIQTIHCEFTPNTAGPTPACFGGVCPHFRCYHVFSRVPTAAPPIRLCVCSGAERERD